MLSVRSWLAEATATLHARVDLHAGGYGLDDRAGAEDFLAFIAEGVAAVEEGLTARALLDPASARALEGIAFRPDLSRHARVKRPPVPFFNEAEVWGGLYTLEGSKLGARVLARTHPRLSDADGFDAEGPMTWPAFLQRLDSADKRLNQRNDMAKGAGKAFGAFLALIDEDVLFAGTRRTTIRPGRARSAVAHSHHGDAAAGARP